MASVQHVYSCNLDEEKHKHGPWSVTAGKNIKPSLSFVTPNSLCYERGGRQTKLIMVS